MMGIPLFGGTAFLRLKKKSKKSLAKKGSRGPSAQAFRGRGK